MSKPVVVSIPHELGRVQAKARLEAGFDRFAQQFGQGVHFTKSWTGDRLSFAAKVVGQDISGHLDVFDQAVRMEVLLPGVLGLIANKIQGKLRREGQLLLEKK